jgi:hypothetical protein
VIYEDGDSEYHLVKLEETCPEATCSFPVAEETIKRELPDGTAVVGSSNGADPVADDRFTIKDSVGNLLDTSINDPGVTSTVEFNSDGSSYAASGPIAGLKVGSADNASRCWKITVQSSTSRVKQAKDDGCS